jgi:uncharacterized membrane protein HdeD (DUF308 family)
MFDNTQQINIILCIVSIVAAFVGLYFLFNYLPSIDYSQFFNSAFLIIAGLIALVIVYTLFVKKMNNWDTWYGFVLNMIFYIPCMLSDAYVYLTNDWMNTSTQITVLFAIEIACLLFYVYGIPAFEHSIYNNGILMLNQPVFLNRETTISKVLQDGKYDKEPAPYYSNVGGLFRDLKQGPSQYRRNYAISMWVYMNIMPNTRIGYVEETNVLYYGTSNEGTDDPESYHPRVSYENVKGVNKYNIYYSGNKRTHQIELPGQKWNNLVFNYRADGVDVFVNGELSLSHTFSDDNETPLYDIRDAIIVGDSVTIGSNGMGINGLYGSICSVAYYKRPLKKSEIVGNYNMLSVRNPPILDR